MAAGLARAIEELGWNVSVQLDNAAPRGEFAVYFDERCVFSRFSVGRFPEPADIIPELEFRLFGETAAPEGR
jgi:hypothetical protein